VTEQAEQAGRTEQAERAGVVTATGVPAAPEVPGHPQGRHASGAAAGDGSVLGRVWRPVWPLVAMLVVGGLLYEFLVASRQHKIRFGYFPQPPIYGLWVPAFSTQALIVVPAALLLVAVGVLVIAWLRIPSWLALLLVIAAGVVLGAAVTASRGGLHEVVVRLSEGFGGYYTADMHFVGQYGIRGFGSHYPDLGPQFYMHNVRTHPPGVVVLFYVLFDVIGTQHVLRITLVLAVVAMAAAVPAWAIGRELGGERAGRVSAVLFAAAPGPLLLAYSSADAIFATLLSSAAALFLIAIRRHSARWAAGGGAVLALAAYLTYAISFVGLAAVVAALITVRPLKDLLRLLGGAAAGGLAVLALERIVLGYDIVRSYRSAAQDGLGRPYDPYWIVGHPAAMLIFAGLPLAALGVVGLFRRAADGRFSALPVTLVALMIVWGSLPAVITHLRSGEVERTWAFLYPLLAGTAGPVVARWMDGRRRPWVGYALVLLLVAISAAQATVIQVFWVFVRI
jgi:hypothetical protein